MTPPAARARHIPVLGREVLASLQPREGGIYVDATFGAGGYSAPSSRPRRRESSASTATAPQYWAVSNWSSSQMAVSP